MKVKPMQWLRNLIQSICYSPVPFSADRETSDYVHIGVNDDDDGYDDDGDDDG